MHQGQPPSPLALAVADSGEGRWTAQEAIEQSVPAPVISVGPVTVHEAPVFTLVVPALSRTVPAPVMPAPEFRSCVPPPNSRVFPLAEVKLPVLVPPPPRVRVPLWAFTVPVLLTVMLRVVESVPADFLSVPELLNAAVPPKGLLIVTSF